MPENLDSSNGGLTTLGGSVCPVCGSSTAQAIDLGDFNLYRCADCDCWCSDALVRSAELSFDNSKYFDNDDADVDKWEDTLGRLGRERGAPLSVLDIGCGTGAFLSYMQERNPEGTRAGIELDTPRSSLARKSNPDAIVLTGDAVAKLDEITDQFDLITLWDLYEHVPAPDLLLRRLAERLAPGGHIFIQTIHEQSVVPFLGRLSYRVTGGRVTALARRTHDAHHIVFYSKKGLGRLAGNANLRIRQRWFDRLALSRMDGNPLFTAATSALLALENFAGNGLFVNLILDAKPDS